MDIPTPHQCQELGCLNNRSLCGRERKGALYLLSGAMLPSPAFAKAGEGGGWNEGSDQPETRLPHPRWQIRLLAQASAGELFYSAGLGTQMYRVDPPEQGREKTAYRGLSFTNELIGQLM